MLAEVEEDQLTTESILAIVAAKDLCVRKPETKVAEGRTEDYYLNRVEHMLWHNYCKLTRQMKSLLLPCQFSVTFIGC